MKLLGVVNYKISAVILNIIFIDTAVTFFIYRQKEYLKIMTALYLL